MTEMEFVLVAYTLLALGYVVMASGHYWGRPRGARKPCAFAEIKKTIDHGVGREEIEAALAGAMRRKFSGRPVKSVTVDELEQCLVDELRALRGES